MNPGEYFHLAVEEGARVRFTYVVEARGYDRGGQVWIAYRWISPDGAYRLRKVTLAEFEELRPYCPLEYAVSYRAAALSAARTRRESDTVPRVEF